MIKFTPREQETIEHLKQGKANADIAKTMGIKLETVKIHIFNIMKKTGCKNRMQIVLIAQRRDAIEAKKALASFLGWSHNVPMTQDIRKSLNTVSKFVNTCAKG